MKIQKILTVTPQEKKELQTAMSPLEELVNIGRDFCNDIGYCTDCPFHNQNYTCPIDTFNSNNIISDLEEFINQLPVAEED